MEHVWLGGGTLDLSSAYMDVQTSTFFWGESKDIVSRIKALGYFGADGSVT